uniref:Transmembrane protein 192 n=1 Tax=Macrostomum lignano TaxID=282301 RepID=A0A1I8GSX2_9PLAT
MSVSNATNGTEIQLKLEYENDILIQLLYNTLSCLTILSVCMLALILYDYEVRYQLVSIGILPVIQSLEFHMNLLFSLNFAALRDSLRHGDWTHMRVEDNLHWRRRFEVGSMVRQAVQELQLPDSVATATAK